MTQLNAAIWVKGLVKVFRTRQGATVTAVDGLDLSMTRGETFGIIGPDGAGKSTTLRLLVGLLQPTRGEMKVLGLDPLRHSQQMKSCIGYMSQNFELYADLTVKETLRFFADLHGVSGKEQAQRIPELLGFVGLQDAAHRLGSQLSGGMRKKLALACVLVHSPEVLFLDEPTLGVDPVSRRQFWDLLASLRAEKGVTICVTTPYMDEAERCHRVALLFNGRIIAQDTPRAIRRLLPGTLLDCHPTDFERTKVLVSGLPGVLEMQSQGNRLRIFVDDANVRAPEIEAVLAHAHIPARVKVAQPRMEDAFIHLVRRQARNAQNPKVC